MLILKDHNDLLNLFIEYKELPVIHLYIEDAPDPLIAIDERCNVISQEEISIPSLCYN